ncbi:unnamed protein product [Adineta steineri]|uniref:Uncharacterized protein n=1 Tax=Adineta steineri TaxID=433720 RepID=A0A814MWZ6_9BILA|nr:unnamed protein product [Adineta steineri]CAF3620422.1 unnamed protein product [Adineta steineri]
MASSMLLSKNHIGANIMEDEKFEAVYRPDEHAIQIVNHERTCEKFKRGACGCTLGSNSYSSGVHQIKVKIHHGNAFLGIRSRNIVPIAFDPEVPQYDDTPSTCGWWTQSGCSRCNGIFRDSNLPEIASDNNTFILTVNCEEYRLSIVNENTNAKDEMEVDRLHVPFPWCLFVVLPRTLSRVSLV